MKILGLQIMIERSAYYAFVVLALIPLIVIVGYTTIFHFENLNGKTVTIALLTGICFASFHEIAQFVHQLGHALVARLLGQPMKGVRQFAVFSFSEYPANEPVLPDKLHILRSLGGVVALALVFTVVFWTWLGIPASASEFTRWLLDFLLFDSALLFFTSAIISDGLLFILNKGWKTAQP